MTERELRRLSRRELLELLIEATRERAELEEKYEKALEALRERRIAVSNAGSIAEAALQLNGVFEAAEAACAQYQENLRALSEEGAARGAEIEREARQKADALLAETEARCAAREKETEARGAEKTKKAEADAQASWEAASAKLSAFCDDHRELRQLLTALTGPEAQHA